MKIAVTGASGLIGRRLTGALTDAGHDVIRLVRRPPQQAGEVEWDPGAHRLAAADLAGVDAAVNLAGPGVGDHRWSAHYKQQVQGARVAATRLLAEVLAQVDPLPQVLLSGSAVGFYGNRGEDTVDETSPAGTGFLAAACVAWELAAAPASRAGVRVASLRTGIVLSADGGALAKQLPLYRAGLGGPLGSGRQFQSWISLTDAVAAIGHLLDHDVAGPVNLTAPTPVRQREFAATLGHVLHRPAVLPAPAFAVRLALGEFADEGVLAGQRVLPKALQESGFHFTHDNLEGALRAELDR